MENKKKTERYYLDEQWILYIEDYKEQYGFGSISNALTSILKEHDEYRKRLFDLNYIVQSMKNEILNQMKNSIEEVVTEEMRRIRLGTNNTDRNTQILIELLQGMMVLNNVQAITTTDQFKPKFLEFTEGVVHNRIIHQKQKKDNKMNRQGGKNQ